MKLDHAGLSVADLDAAARFYADAFGFEREFEFDLREIRGVMLHTAACGSRSSRRPGAAAGCARRRRSRRCPRAGTGVRFAFLADPEGNLVELMQR